MCLKVTFLIFLSVVVRYYRSIKKRYKEMQIKILLLEEGKDCKELYTYIQSLGVSSVKCVYSILQANEIISKENINLLITDIAIYKKSKWTFLNALPKNTKIIYLTNCKEIEIITKAVQTEPIGYLLKPYNKIELLALLKLVDFQCQKEENLIYFDKEYFFNTHKGQLYKNNTFIKLSTKEKKLLTLLVEANNTIISFEEIEELWEYPPKPSTLRTMIYRLRNKLKGKFIVTVPNQGLQLKIYKN
jgi:DNA-binding response OmpR family regulator